MRNIAPWAGVAAAILLLGACSGQGPEAADPALAQDEPAAAEAATPAAPTPEDDRLALRAYFEAKYPDIDIETYVDGPYAMSKEMRKQWEAKMEFPAYEFALEDGKELFETPFANGKTYADCFENGGIGVRQTWPRFDTDRGEVVTLEMAINECREANGEAPYPWLSEDLTSLSAYFSDTSRGKRFDIKIPDDPRALEAYHQGEEYWYSRRGQLGFSCSSCHVTAAGERLRAEHLAPAVGIVAAFPIHRSDWGEMGTVMRRFMTCDELVRSKALEPQSETYRNLEYFLTYMSNDLQVSGPGVRP